MLARAVAGCLDGVKREPPALRIADPFQAAADPRMASKGALSIRRCGLGALITAAYELTDNYDAAHELAHTALRPRFGISTLVHVNDVRGHAAVLALFDEVIAAQPPDGGAQLSEPE